MSEQRKYVLISDSTCDLPSEIVSQMGIKLMKFTFEIDGKTYPDGGMEFHDFYDMMRHGSSTKTSQISPSQAEITFEEALKRGFDILCLSFSSGLSGTYNSACIARDNLMEKYPKAKIICIDSLCASTACCCIRPGRKNAQVWASMSSHAGSRRISSTSVTCSPWMILNIFREADVYQRLLPSQAPSSA